MKRKMASALVAAVVVLCAAAFGPSAPSAATGAIGSIEQASAQVSKSRGEKGGGGDAAKVGDRAADLGSGWAIPLTVFIAGVLLTVALVSRNVGTAVGVVLVAVIALIFFGDPDAISGFAQDVGNAIF
jgi:hypothetical protein